MILVNTELPAIGINVHWPRSPCHIPCSDHPDLAVDVRVHCRTFELDGLYGSLPTQKIL